MPDYCVEKRDKSVPEAGNEHEKSRVRTHNQHMMGVASAMAERKTVGDLS
jgi:hypothetical protein